MASRPAPDFQSFIAAIARRLDTAARRLVLPARHTDTGLRVDFIFSTTPYERQAIARAVRVNVGDAAVPFASAEDLIIHKLFAARPRDLDDAVGVVRRAADRLDWPYIARWVAEFAQVPGRERMPDLLSQLRRDALGP